jgi:GNAT superfamily N-acetyltransferase
MEILRAKPAEAPALSGIAFAAKQHWGYPARWMEQWRNVLTLQPDFIAQHETYTAFLEGQAIGFYSLRRGLDRMHLEHLWVLPQKMGRGIGRTLFAHAIEQLKAAGFRTLEIESDPNAAGFYERMGARQVGVTVTELEGQSRELPVLIYEINHPSATIRAGKLEETQDTLGRDP